MTGHTPRAGHGSLAAAGQFLGLNRITLAMPVMIGCLGLSEAPWSSDISLHLADSAGAEVPQAFALQSIHKRLPEVLGLAVLYVYGLLANLAGWRPAAAAPMVGTPVAVGKLTALATGMPVARRVDRSPSPRPCIGLTFLLFALFPILLVVLPRVCAAPAGRGWGAT